MSNSFNFFNINQYENYIIEINKNEFYKMKRCISTLKTKYNNEILDLYKLEKNNSKKFDFFKQREFITRQKQTLLNIISDVLNYYREELNNLSVVFLSGSFARGTNKMSSDIDLHFFYKNNDYNYIHEEIVSYIISRIVNKSRDCIDPTFIFNIENDTKTMITNKMDKSKLRIILKYKKKKIQYSYKYGKKRRFYLQYTNTRDIRMLFHYLDNEITIHNSEWCHCFEITKGQDYFNKLYDKIYKNELKIVSNDYINSKIKLLKEKIEIDKQCIVTNSISQYKKYYQSKTFEWIYEYISIIRFILIKDNKTVKFLNLFEIYDKIASHSNVNKNIIIEIYKYMWSLEKLSIYCYENKINYGLHNDDIINYSRKELDNNLVILKKLILDDLERLENLYE